MNRRCFLKTGLASIALLSAPSLCFGGFRYPVYMPDSKTDEGIKDYLHKMEHFYRAHPEDVCLPHSDMKTLDAVIQRLKRIQQFVGFGNFYIVSFDQALRYAKHYPKIGAFSKNEQTFMESLFYTSASEYGFRDSKVFASLTSVISRKEVDKIPYTGNFLYKGKPQKMYAEIRKALGDKVILTSGVRGVIKQFYLFLCKVQKSNGNLSLASRSLAPPGYSFHGRGDFDVGDPGLGVDNFTNKFTATTAYKRLTAMGFLKLRYPHNNQLGVRFEPWHIKVEA